MNMRNFDEIQRELDLIPFLESANGDLYLPRDVHGPQVIVRRFNRSLDPSRVESYARFLADAQAWIDRDAELSALLRVEQPMEVGADFLARRFVSATSLASFVDTDSEDDPPDAPDELAPMQSRFRDLVSQTRSPGDSLVASVLARSILEPTNKTVYSFREERFIVLDPKLTGFDLEQLRTLQTFEASQGDPA
jgi:hypothetical protein